MFREFGKEVKGNIEPLSREKAEALGQDIARSSLTASYKVVPSSLPLPVASRLKFATGVGTNPFAFAPAKSSALKGYNVQKAEFRLASGSERREIQQSKRRNIFAI